MTHSFFRWSNTLFLTLLFFSSFSDAWSDSPLHRIRSGDTPCGLYLSTKGQDSLGEKVAGLTAESIEAFFKSNPDLDTRSIYVDEKTGERLEDPAQLKEALQEGRANLIQDSKTLSLVGEWGKNLKQLDQLTKDLLERQNLNAPVKVNRFGRPRSALKKGVYLHSDGKYEKIARIDPREMRAVFGDPDFPKRIQGKSIVLVGLPYFGEKRKQVIRVTEKLTERTGEEAPVKAPRIPPNSLKTMIDPVNLFRRFIYLFLLPQDFQPPTGQEVNTALTKLVVSNTSQTVVALIIKPTGLPLNSLLMASGMNYGNSLGTGVFRKALSNWMNRSGSSMGRLIRGAMLSSFFVMDMFFASRGFRGFFSSMVWAELITNKWTAVATSLSWRFSYGNGVLKWEHNTETKDPHRARTTASHLEFLGTLTATPFFIIASIWDGGWTLRMAGQDLMQLNIGHIGMFTVGLAGAFIYFKPDLIDHPKLKIPERLEKTAILFQKLVQRLGVSQAKKVLVGIFSKKRDPWSKPSLPEYLELDSEQAKWIQQDSEIMELIREHQDTLKAIETGQKKLEKALSPDEDAA